MVALIMTLRNAQAKTAIEYAVAARPLNGHAISGDVYLVQEFVNGVLLAVIDGAGHGAEATIAARAAASVLENHAGESVIGLMQRSHEALRELRGAAMTVVSIHSTNDSFEWLGVGNVEGCCFRADATNGPRTEAVMLRGGIVGYQLPPLRANVAAIAPGNLLVLATDGIRSDFPASVSLGEAPEKIAQRILARHFRGTDDGLVLVTRYLGGGNE
jgi:phosphoserine phosphatase RsbX